MLGQNFPPCTAEQVLCKDALLKRLQKKQAQWFRQRAEYEHIAQEQKGEDGGEPLVGAEAARSAILDGDTTVDMALGGTQRGPSKAQRKKLLEEMSELQQLSAEMRNHRDALLGVDAKRSDELAASTTDSSTEDEDFRRALHLSLAESEARHVASASGSASELTAIEYAQFERAIVASLAETDRSASPPVPSPAPPTTEARATTSPPPPQKANMANSQVYVRTSFDEELFDSELAEINDFLVAIGLQDDDDT
mmetsp:Transcript_23034/g.38555  ORF Transcript_23034/g.38555 Transcript_23034/m.38555 type:complete len:252 (-) Transcript_23034:71-826(-)